MVVTTNLVTGSSTAFSTLQISGTQFTNNNTVQLCLMLALSGLALIPVKCDSIGRIGSVTA